MCTAVISSLNSVDLIGHFLKQEFGCDTVYPLRCGGTSFFLHAQTYIYANPSHSCWISRQDPNKGWRGRWTNSITNSSFLPTSWLKHVQAILHGYGSWVSQWKCLPSYGVHQIHCCTFVSRVKRSQSTYRTLRAWVSVTCHPESPDSLLTTEWVLSLLTQLVIIKNWKFKLNSQQHNGNNNQTTRRLASPGTHTQTEATQQPHLRVSGLRLWDTHVICTQNTVRIRVNSKKSWLTLGHSVVTRMLYVFPDYVA
jgi:hypothetical protein